MTPRSQRLTGPVIAVITAVVSGFAIFLNGYGVASWSDAGVGATAYTTAKNLVAALVLGAIALMSLRRRGRETRIQQHRWRLLAVGIIGGAVPFVLFFEGLARASSLHGAFIHKTLVVWVALIAVPVLGERLSGLHLAAIGLLVGGEAAIAGVHGIRFGAGEAMILAATLLWAIEVVVAKVALRDVPATIVGAARMGIGAVVLAGWTIASGGMAGLTSLPAVAWAWVALTGAVLTAYVATWYLALSRAQAVDVTAVLVLGALVSAALRTGFSGVGHPAPIGVVLLALGGIAALVAMRRPAPR